MEKDAVCLEGVSVERISAGVFELPAVAFQIAAKVSQHQIHFALSAKAVTEKDVVCLETVSVQRIFPGVFEVPAVALQIAAKVSHRQFHFALSAKSRYGERRCMP